MAWTDGKVKRACCLHASMWSAGAIGIALDMTRSAVLGKFFRLRKKEDIDILMADLSRTLAAAGGARVIDAEAIHDLQQQHGFRAGLEKAVAETVSREAISPRKGNDDDRNAGTIGGGGRGRSENPASRHAGGT